MDNVRRHGTLALAILLAAIILVPGCGSDEVTDPEQWPLILLDLEQPIERRREAAVEIRVLAKGNRRPLVANTLLTVVQRDSDMEVRLRALDSIKRIGPFTEEFIKKLEVQLAQEEDPVVKASLRNAIAALKTDTAIRPSTGQSGPRGTGVPGTGPRGTGPRGTGPPGTGPR